MKRCPFPYKILMILILILALKSDSYCQLHIGLKGGTNFATTIVGNSTNYYRFAYYGGVTASVDFNNKFYFLTELLYSKKGNKIGPTFESGDNHNLNYLSLPLLVGYRIRKRFSFLLGTEVSYLLGENATGFDYTTAGFERIDIGIASGFSYSLSRNLAVELRYIYGLSPISKAVITTSYPWGTSVATANGRDRGLNRDFQLGINYRIW